MSKTVRTGSVTGAIRQLWWGVMTVFAFPWLTSQVHAQINRRFNEDSLYRILKTAPMDTNRINILLMLSESYFFKQPALTLQYSLEAVRESKKLRYTKGIQEGYFRAGEAKRNMGDFVEAIKIQLEGLAYNRTQKDSYWEANSLGWMGICYFELQDYSRSIEFLRQALIMHEKQQRITPTTFLFSTFLSKSFLDSGQPDSAKYYLRKTEGKEQAARLAGPNLRALFVQIKGDLFFGFKLLDSARYYYDSAMTIVFEDTGNTQKSYCRGLGMLARLAEMEGKTNLTLYYASQEFQLAKKTGLKPQMLEAARLLYGQFKELDIPDSAYFYAGMVAALNDSIYGQKRFNELQLLLLDEQNRNQQVIAEKQKLQSQTIIWSLVAFAAVIMTIGFILYRSHRKSLKSNRALEKTLKELQLAQSQLIQSEKMASLGELTAGIAHEIQNPLNFVNNFSDLNKELIEELQEELKKGDIQEATSIAENLKDNEEKINLHGRRADGIVKSMLQHSRASGGQKERTDVNKLVDEYVRLAYHGFRAKYKDFNVKLDIDLDPNLPLVPVVAQDIGRVILNLLNNAFQAVEEKAKTAGENYHPTVSIKTLSVHTGHGMSGNTQTQSRIEHPTSEIGNPKSIAIAIADNGPGIPDSIKEKIFQPFFTTKPTGQGTGLGLSLSYDIVKAHGGEISLQAHRDEGTEFVIFIPNS